MAMLVLSFPHIFFAEVEDGVDAKLAPVAYLSPPPWCAKKGAVLVDPGDDWDGIDFGAVFIFMQCVLARNSLSASIRLQARPQHEHT